MACTTSPAPCNATTSRAVGVVVGHVRAAVAARDPEVDEQLRDGRGRHAGAAVGVQAGWCAVDVAGDLDEVLGDIAVLAGRDGPPDEVAAVDVQDDVEVVVDPTVRAAELGDVPRPRLRSARLSRSANGQLGAVPGGAVVSLRSREHKTCI